MQKQMLHYPRLDTVLRVEKFIQKTSGTYTKTQLWRRLPKKTMYQTFSIILNYLSDSNKIAIDSEGKIGWIWNPELVKKYLSKKGLSR